MPTAEYVTFNGEWTKDCSKCKRHYGSNTGKDGLAKFFSRIRSYKDGLSYLCKVCEREKDRARSPREWKKRKSKRKHDPVKYKARTLLNNSIAKGLILKPKDCQKCRKVTTIHGHHEDYSKPLDVLWLCQKCHADVHFAKRELL